VKPVTCTITVTVYPPKHNSCYVITVINPTSSSTGLPAAKVPSEVLLWDCCSQ